MTVTVEQLVSREVHHCVSALVSTIASGHGCWNATQAKDLSGLIEQAGELATPVDDWKEAATQEGWQWDEGGPHFFRNSPGASPFAPYEYEHIKVEDWQALCEANDIEPYQWEVYEHWIVSEWLADELIKHGERVDKDFAGLCIWGRTTTGQAISQDAVIQKIHAELTAA